MKNRLTHRNFLVNLHLLVVRVVSLLCPGILDDVEDSLSVPENEVHEGS